MTSFEMENINKLKMKRGAEFADTEIAMLWLIMLLLILMFLMLMLLMLVGNAVASTNTVVDASELLLASEFCRLLPAILIELQF